MRLPGSRLTVGKEAAVVPVEGPLAHRLAEVAEDELVRCVGVVGVVEGEVGLPNRDILFGDLCLP